MVGRGDSGRDVGAEKNAVPELKFRPTYRSALRTVPALCTVRPELRPALRQVARPASQPELQFRRCGRIPRGYSAFLRARGGPGGLGCRGLLHRRPSRTPARPAGGLGQRLVARLGRHFAVHDHGRSVDDDVGRNRLVQAVRPRRAEFVALERVRPRPSIASRSRPARCHGGTRELWPWEDPKHRLGDRQVEPAAGLLSRHARRNSTIPAKPNLRSSNDSSTARRVLAHLAECAWASGGSAWPRRTAGLPSWTSLERPARCPRSGRRSRLARLGPLVNGGVVGGRVPWAGDQSLQATTSATGAGRVSGTAALTALSASSTRRLRSSAAQGDLLRATSFCTKSRNVLTPNSRSENVESSCSSVLFSTPSCGVTSRSARTLRARLTSGIASLTSLLAPPRLLLPRAADEVLVGDEFRAVLLQDHAREGAAADHEHLAVVELELLDQRHEVAVAADDHEGVDVAVGEGHLQRVEREVDVGAVLVATGRQVALDHLDGVLSERAAVVTGAGPIPVRHLGDHLAAFFHRFEHGADVEMATEGGLDADLDIVEVDEEGDLEAGSVKGNSCTSHARDVW